MRRRLKRRPKSRLGHHGKCPPPGVPRWKLCRGQKCHWRFLSLFVGFTSEPDSNLNLCYCINDDDYDDGGSDQIQFWTFIDREMIKREDGFHCHCTNCTHTHTHTHTCARVHTPVVSADGILAVLASFVRTCMAQRCSVRETVSHVHHCPTFLLRNRPNWLMRPCRSVCCGDSATGASTLGHLATAAPAPWSHTSGLSHQYNYLHNQILQALVSFEMVRRKDLQGLQYAEKLCLPHTHARTHTHTHTQCSWTAKARLGGSGVINQWRRLMMISMSAEEWEAAEDHGRSWHHSPEGQARSAGAAATVPPVLCVCARARLHVRFSIILHF